jgi:hypothetical protein
MEASGEQPISKREIHVRQVTHWQLSGTEAAGGPGDLFDSADPRPGRRGVRHPADR